MDQKEKINKRHSVVVVVVVFFFLNRIFEKYEGQLFGARVLLSSGFPHLSTFAMRNEVKVSQSAQHLEIPVRPGGRKGGGGIGLGSMCAPHMRPVTHTAYFCFLKNCPSRAKGVAFTKKFLLHSRHTTNKYLHISRKRQLEYGAATGTESSFEKNNDSLIQMYFALACLNVNESRV